MRVTLREHLVSDGFGPELAEDVDEAFVDNGMMGVWLYARSCDMDPQELCAVVRKWEHERTKGVLVESELANE